MAITHRPFSEPSARIWRVASKPSITGICTSMSTASKAVARSKESACSPSWASMGVMPTSASMPLATSRLNSLSSTTSTSFPCSMEWYCCVEGAGAASATGAMVCERGKDRVNQKVLPCPGVLVTPTSPPIRCTSWRLIAKPKPVPPYFRVVELSACSNDWNRRCCCSTFKPMPVSRTSKHKCALSPRASVARVVLCTINCTLPFSVNLMALLR